MTDNECSDINENATAMKETSPLPMVSLVIAGIACLGIPIGMSRVWPQGQFRAFFFVALLVALASVVLGVAGIVKTKRRVPAGIAIAVGTILSLIYGVIFWLSTPF